MPGCSVLTSSKLRGQRRYFHGPGVLAKRRAEGADGSDSEKDGAWHQATPEVKAPPKKDVVSPTSPSASTKSRPKTPEVSSAGVLSFILNSMDLDSGVSKNRGTPKWMVYNGKPYLLIDDLGGFTPLFLVQHPFLKLAKLIGQASPHFRSKAEDYRLPTKSWMARIPSETSLEQKRQERHRIVGYLRKQIEYQIDE